MKKDRVYTVSEDKLLLVFDLIRSDNSVSKETISKILRLGIVTVYRAISELKRRKWIKARHKRNGIVEVYDILKKS
jgi:Mn-dependent DtxR family transcriptional regulator